jgi:hypothetical protein
MKYFFGGNTSGVLPSQEYSVDDLKYPLDDVICKPRSAKATNFKPRDRYDE